MDTAVSNALGMFINAFIAGLVATVLPGVIAGINTQTGQFNVTWAIVYASLTVNFLTSVILGLNEYVRVKKSDRMIGKRGWTHDYRGVKGFLPF
jgi:uncharacterized integral membrane protein